MTRDKFVREYARLREAEQAEFPIDRDNAIRATADFLYDALSLNQAAPEQELSAVRAHQLDFSLRA